MSRSAIETDAACTQLILRHEVGFPASEPIAVATAGANRRFGQPESKVIFRLEHRCLRSLIAMLTNVAGVALARERRRWRGTELIGALDHA